MLVVKTPWWLSQDWLNMLMKNNNVCWNIFTRAIHKLLMVIIVTCKQRYVAIKKLCMSGTSGSWTFTQWKVNAVDKYGPHGSCGRKVCRLAAVCAEAAPNHRTVFHWVETFNSGHGTVKKGISPGCLPRAHMSSAVELVSWIIMENRHVTIDEPQLTTSLCHAKICAIIHQHFMMKVHAPWVPWDLMPKQKEKRVQNCHKLLALHKNQEELFVRLFTGDESWFHFKLWRWKGSLCSGNIEFLLLECR